MIYVACTTNYFQLLSMHNACVSCSSSREFFVLIFTKLVIVVKHEDDICKLYYLMMINYNNVKLYRFH